MSSKTAEKAVEKQKVDLDPRFIGKLTVTLLSICAAVALMLGIVNHITAPIITQMQEEKTRAAMSQVLEAEEYIPMSVQMENVTELHKAMNGSKQVGYIAEVVSNGFGGAMHIVVGVDMDGGVTGVIVTKNSETANLGTKVTNDPEVLARFTGKNLADGEITVNNGDNCFDGVSGATVSSKAVTAGVNTALAAVAANK